MSPASLIDVLQKVIDRQGAMLVAARADEEERALNRRLREEQDEAYQTALLADQVTCQKASRTLSHDPYIHDFCSPNGLVVHE